MARQTKNMFTGQGICGTAGVAIVALAAFASSARHTAQFAPVLLFSLCMLLSLCAARFRTAMASGRTVVLLTNEDRDTKAVLS
jgi:hypothetical protein